MTDAEKNTNKEYYPPKGDLPSINITLNQARKQYQYYENVKHSLTTKGSISLSLAIAIITIISSINFILFPVLMISISCLCSISAIFPTSHLIPGPSPDDYYKFSRNQPEKTKDILLLSYHTAIKKSRKQTKLKGYLIWISFLITTLGTISYIILL